MQTILSCDGNTQHARNVLATSDKRGIIPWNLSLRVDLEFLPQTFLSMVPVLTSFLPPTHVHLYLPMLFKLWEPFNSSAMDDRLLDLAGSLAEEHVAGLNREEIGGAQWKDVGIWSQTEWNVLIGKGLGSMSMCATTSFTEFSSLFLSQTFLWGPHKYVGL